MHILIAPNAFKHSLSAADAAAAIRDGLLRSKLQCTCECFPVGDGGDGTGELLSKRLEAQFFKVNVHNPLGKIIESRLAILPGKRVAIIEMADASGIRLLSKHQLDPLACSSYGTGELIKEALSKGVKEVILAIGGSATVDGGTGILSALGVKFLDHSGQVLEAKPASLQKLYQLDLSGLDPRITEAAITILCDVENHLLGEHGAAKTFGPQKGAGPSEVNLLESFLENFAQAVFRQTGRDLQALKHGGAAGGVAAGLASVLNARLVNGIDYFLNETGFDRSVELADLVITGEGSIDEQTLHGKAPHGVAVRAKARSRPVIGLSGRLDVMPDAALYDFFDVLLPLLHAPADLDQALLFCRENLERTAKEIGNMLYLSGKQ